MSRRSRDERSCDGEADGAEMSDHGLNICFPDGTQIPFSIGTPVVRNRLPLSEPALRSRVQWDRRTGHAREIDLPGHVVDLLQRDTIVGEDVE